MVPAGILRTLREETLENPNPVAITATLALQTSRPIMNHVFCADCEDLLSKNGEGWVVPRIAQAGSFPLHDDLISQLAPLYDDTDVAIYAGAGIPGLGVDKLVYFALSMFWRQAAHHWTAISKIRDIILGPYQEPIRRFLRGEGAFPRDTVVLLHVWPVQPILRAVILPFEQKMKEFRFFRFYIPGIEFQLCTGQRIPNNVRIGCSYSSPQRPILVSKSVHANAVALIKGSLDIARPSKNLDRFLNGPDPRKRN